ncbi:TlpA family protein disulfide reductase [Flavilitoribacter nigricans]|uniref:Thioredoxin domain-containing protein n=1 Tax=Flavilitoribacter nigricans (strain ATCC 23147 / DSM 23189 / NBRC 102662 / NCIMB 1420 / SS-2) TaxID=1122177 RepID=A0A2D0NF99_FLAN2|nr:TlpA disulfide reductase family protein [Flavilitoribacter nigricans]PHN07184.1 hypothetical protein CRP01_08135 [Flavilitoribacter nigricans DSM 23189 = NBRC 102662]
MNYKCVFLLLLSTLLFTCRSTEDPVEIQAQPVNISGKIENYQGIYNTGKMTYFDAVTRTIKDEIFPIDSLGNFAISFPLTHPVINSIYFDLEGGYYNDFLVRPNTDYSLTFRGQELVFNGASGADNREMSDFKEALHAAMGEKLERADTLHNAGLSISDYIDDQKELEAEKMAFLENYREEHQLSEAVLAALRSEIRFKTAHAWINYRYTYESGAPRPRKSLPENFYSDLFTAYPVSNLEDIQTRVCIDYLANIMSVLSRESIDPDDKVLYFKNNTNLSPEELELIRRLFEGDRSVTNKQEFKDLAREHNDALRELDIKYRLHALLQNVQQVPTALARDLVIGQGIAEHYYENSLVPTDEEWAQIAGHIHYPSILEHLKAQSPEQMEIKDPETVADAGGEAVEVNLEAVREKYIDKYKGKVIYIDFYATWCGPCRQEIPHAKRLHQEFKDEAVVFLNLCAQSKEQDWENMKKQYALEGENYFLTNEEFYLLSATYQVDAFPTYVLIDKSGAVVNYDALRPSSTKALYDRIRELL